MRRIHSITPVEVAAPRKVYREPARILDGTRLRYAGRRRSADRWAIALMIVSGFFAVAFVAYVLYPAMASVTNASTGSTSPAQP